MRTSIITIGGAKGILIPELLLEVSGLSTTVELQAKKGEIRMNPAEPELKKSVVLNDEYLLSLGAFSDWNNPEEDAAWAHLQ